MMKAKELRKEARESLKGHKGKAGGTYLVYLLVTLILSFVLGFISVFVPDILKVVIEILLSLVITAIVYGCITVLMRIKRNENVSAFSCVYEGMKKFGKIIACGFWTCMKLLLWIILMVVGFVLLDLAERTSINNSLGDVMKNALEYQIQETEDIARVEYSSYQMDMIVEGKRDSIATYEEWFEDSEYKTQIEEARQQLEEYENRELKKDYSDVYGLVGTVLFFVSMIMLIIRSLRYSLVNFLIYDNPDMSGRQIVNKSAELMKGNCGRIFGLGLSFIGWIFLIYLGMGFSASLMSFYSSSAEMLIGTIVYIAILFATIFFLTPYMQMANICFYEELVTPTEKDENEENVTTI